MLLTRRVQWLGKKDEVLHSRIPVIVLPGFSNPRQGVEGGRRRSGHKHHQVERGKGVKRGTERGEERERERGGGQTDRQTDGDR